MCDTNLCNAYFFCPDICFWLVKTHAIALLHSFIHTSYQNWYIGGCTLACMNILSLVFRPYQTMDTCQMCHVNAEIQIRDDCGVNRQSFAADTLSAKGFKHWPMIGLTRSWKDWVIISSGKKLLAKRRGTFSIQSHQITPPSAVAVSPKETKHMTNPESDEFSKWAFSSAMSRIQCEVCYLKTGFRANLSTTYIKSRTRSLGLTAHSALWTKSQVVPRTFSAHHCHFVTYHFTFISG